jgi:hypothetical protein
LKKGFIRKIHKARFVMSVLKGKIHHMAEGASAGAGVVAGVAGAVAVVAGVAGVAGVGAGLGAVVAGVVAGVGAGAVADKAHMYRYAIPVDIEKTWQRRGAGLLATFSLACGIGAETLVYNYLPKNDNNAPQTKQTTPTTNRFNVEVGKTDECIIVVKNGQASTLSGPCEVRPALK